MNALSRFCVALSRQFFTVNFTPGSSAGSSVCTIYSALQETIYCRGSGDTAELAAHDAVKNWKTAASENLARIAELELALNGEDHDKP